MKAIILGLVVMATVSCCARASPRFIVIPLEDVQFLNVGPVEGRGARVAREAVYDVPEPYYRRDAEIAASEARHARQAGGGHGDDYVDYGAHTGHHGAFGWYADFPVYTHEH